MKNYTLSLISGTNFTISLNGTALTTAEFAALLINDAGSAQFTPDADAAGFTIWDSSAMDGSSMTSSESITNGKAYEGTWSAAAAGATTNSFITFTEAEGVAMTKFQISDLMSKIKNAGSGGGIDKIYSLKLSELSHESYSGADYYSLFHSGYGEAGLYIIENDTGSNINNVFITLWAIADASGSIDRTVILYNSPIRDGQSIAFYLGITDATATQKEVIVTPISYARNTSSQPSIQITYGVVNTLNSLPISTNLYRPNMAISATSELTYSGSAYSSVALTAIGGNTLYRTIRGNLSSNNVASWTSIGTGSRYTKRALQATLNIAETGLTLTPNDWNTLFTLPSGFRPSAQLTTGVTIMEDGALINGLAQITTAGLVQVYANSSTTEAYGLLTIPVS